MQLGRARDWHDPRFLRKQPSERDLSRCRLLLLRKSAQQIHQRLIRFPVLWRKARDDVAEIAFVELRIFADLPGEEALAQRAKWNESDAEFLERQYHFLFRFSPPQRVFALECSDRLNGMCATDGLHPCFRESEVLHLSLLNQLFHGAGDVFDWNVQIDTMLIEQIDRIHLEPLERRLRNLLDVRRATI